MIDSIQYRWHETTDRVADWAEKHGIGAKNVAVLFPIVAAASIAYLFMSASESVQKLAEKAGGMFKRLVEPVPVLGPVLGGAIDVATSMSSLLLGGAAAVFAFLALQSNKTFTNPLTDPDKEHWLDFINLPKKIERFNQSRGNDAYVANAIKQAALPDTDNYKNLKYYAMSFESEQKTKDKDFKIDFSNNNHLSRLESYIGKRLKEETNIRDKSDFWFSDRWPLIGAGAERIHQYEDAAYHVNALTAAAEELRSFRRDRHAREVTGKIRHEADLEAAKPRNAAPSPVPSPSAETLLSAGQ